jgi:receptor protein-tyrosine kinase
MSKIFDAINRKEGELPDLKEFLEDPVMESHPLSASPSNVDQPESSVPPPPLAAVVSRPEPAAPPKPQPLAPGVRVVPLQLGARSPLLPFDGEHWQAAEQYRVMRTKIIQHPAQPHKIVVSSSGPGDGKTVTAINLAGVLALKTEANVLLIDADFRRSTVHQQLGISPGPGLAGLLHGSHKLEEVLIQAEQFPHLYILPAGKPMANPSEMLSSSMWLNLHERLNASFKYVVVDSPPIATVSDFDLIQSACDGVVFVMRPDHTNRKSCGQALASIPKTKLIGIVVNCVPKWVFGGSHGHGYEYYYGSSVEEASDYVPEP